MRIRYLYFFIISLLLVSCGTPVGRFFSNSKKVEETKQNIVNNEEKVVEKAKGYVYASDVTLSLDKNKNIYSELASKFTSRARLTLGEPSFEEAKIYQEIIDNLLSTNKSIIAKGQKLLDEKDEEVISLQNKNASLQEKLVGQEAKLKEVNEENAKYANIIVKAKRWFWWIVWSVVILFILNTICHALPPPYSSIAYIIGIPFSLIIKLIKGLVPSATKFAGIVSEKTYNETKKALENVVTSIQEVKVKNPESTGLNKLKIELKTNLNEDDKKLINRTKENLGYF